MNRKKLLEICNNYNLASALYKCSYDGMEFHGSLTPAEIIALVNTKGVILKGHKVWQVEWIKQHKRKGDCSPMNFYFESDGELRDLWKKLHPDSYGLDFK